MEINSKEIIQRWEDELIKRISNLDDKPILNIVQIGNRDDSNMYVGNKIKKASLLGIETCMFNVEDTVTQKQLNHLLSKMYNPTILQLPIPTHLNVEEALSYLSPNVDVDGLTVGQEGLLVDGSNRAFIPATANGVVRILEDTCNLSGKKVCIVSRSHLIGKPLIQLLLQRDAYVVVLHTKVPSYRFRQEVKSSDVVITGCGKRAIFNHHDFKDDQIIIDCSMERVNGIKNVGDVDKEDVLNNISCKIASGYGHTGPATVMGLMENVVKYYEMR